MSEPFSDPVLIVAVAMTVFLLAPMVFERLRVPGIIGLLVAGAALGPNGANVLARDPTIVLLGTVGLLYLVFVAALELDLHRFAEYRTRSIGFGLLSFGIPMALGTAFMPLLGFGLPASLLIGSIIGSHTLLAYPTVSRLGLAKNLAVTTVVGGTLITDTLALAVLALVAGAAESGLSPLFLLRLTGGIALFAAVVVVGVPWLGRWFFRNVPGQGQAEYVFVLVMLFGSAFLASVAGAQPIIGAFLAGLALNPLIPLTSPLMIRIRFIGSSLFIPFFLLSVGMLMDVRVLAGDPDVWIISGALIAMVHLGKLAAALVSQRLFGYEAAEGMLMFGLSLPQAAATLAVTFVGLEIGLFGEVVVNSVIVMILMTVLVGPFLVERAGRRIAGRDERRPYVPADAPRRILIPMSNPATAEDLMDLAFLFRDSRSGEAVHPLMVVPDDVRTEAEVAEAEKMLGHAVVYGAGADVPVVPLTRVDRNVASGIIRGITETRSTTVVIGWDGRSGSMAGIFGSVLDQLLSRTKQLVLVAKLGHALNTTSRIIVLLPARSDKNPGFFEAATGVKEMANQLGSSLLLLSFTTDEADYDSIMREIRPDAPIRTQSVGSWDAMLSLLRQIVQPDDLVAVMSARRGSLSWHPKLERLPGILAGLVPQSFLMIYPSEADTQAWDAAAGFLPVALAPRRVIVDLEAADLAGALRQLLEREFGPGHRRVAELTAKLVRSEREFSNEVRPGVLVPHALVDGLEDPILFLGMSSDGIDFRDVREPVRFIFLLLSPLGKPQVHLNALAEVARFVSRAEDLEDLVDWVTRAIPADGAEQT
ncbi:MAG: cation:proton antiporter [Gemmatimonadota bacterium]